MLDLSLKSFIQLSRFTLCTQSGVKRKIKLQVRRSGGLSVRKMMEDEGKGEGSMRAMVMEEARTALKSVQMPIPQPPPGHLRVRVKACAVCRTDLHVFANHPPGEVKWTKQDVETHPAHLAELNHLAERM